MSPIVQVANNKKNWTCFYDNSKNTNNIKNNSKINQLPVTSHYDSYQIYAAMVEYRIVTQL